VKNDFYHPAQCPACQANLFCIMDAMYLLCPHCRSISPFESDGGGGGGGGGIGMGFTLDELCTWQTQILSSRPSSNNSQHAPPPRRASIY
jgi:hypothetical protein